MKPEIADVDATLHYGQSHDLARSALPFTLGGIALGLFLMVPLDGGTPDRRNVWLGGAVVALALAMLVVIVYRRSQPSVPSIVVSPQGVVVREISEKPIPWDEIIEIGSARVKGAREVVSTKVTKLVVSQRFYQQLSGGTWHASTLAFAGDPSEIYVSYFHSVPFDEFQDAVRRRWHTFSHHADGLPSPVGPGDPVPVARHAVRAGVVQRAVRFEGLRALAAMVRKSSPGQLVVSVAAVAGIVAMLTNMLGLWSTTAQVAGRARAAEHRAWKQKLDADLAATAADQRRLKEGMDRSFKCMDDYWALHDRGAYRQDPDCMKAKK